MNNERKTPTVRFEGFTDDWEQRKLGEFVQITSGEAPSKFQAGDCNYVKVDDLNYAYKTVVESQNKVSKHHTIEMVKKGSVIFPKRGAAILTNKVRILGVDSYMDTNMMALSTNELDTEFLYILISKEGLYKIADTSTIPQINNKHIEPYEIVVPKLEEQIKIGAYFRELDNLITLHQRKYDNLLNTKKAMLEKMFPQNGSKVPEIRFKGFTDDWEHRKLGEMVDFYNGDRSSRYPKDSEMVSEGIPFINAGDLVNGRVKLDTANKITEEKYNELSGAKIQQGDIIYCLRGTLGKNALIDNFDVGTVASSLVDIRPKSIYGKYLFQVLNSDIEYSQRVVNDEGAAQPNLSAKNLSQFVIPVPSSLEQEKIATCFENIDNLITLHQRKLEQLKNIKKSLLEKMFV